MNTRLKGNRIKTMARARKCPVKERGKVIFEWVKYSYHIVFFDRPVMWKRNIEIMVWAPQN
jgi:hypothetical protein